MSIRNKIRLVFTITISLLTGVVGSVFTADSVMTWYLTLVKPTLNPPSWVFGPVWTTLYVLMGIAAYRVWRLGLALKLVRLGLSLFGIQLVLNALWSALFFGQQNIGGALVEISFLWVAILATILAFGRVDKKAALLLVPYLLWVSFATYLNASLYLLN